MHVAVALDHDPHLLQLKKLVAFEALSIHLGRLGRHNQGICKMFRHYDATVGSSCAFFKTNGGKKQTRNKILDVRISCFVLVMSKAMRRIEFVASHHTYFAYQQTDLSKPSPHGRFSGLSLLNQRISFTIVKM